MLAQDWRSGRTGRQRKFFISSKDYHARPIVIAEHFIRLNAYPRIRAHPFNLLSAGGKSVETLHFVCEIDGDNVRLIFTGTPKPAESQARQSVSAFLILHPGDSHWRAEYRQIPASLMPFGRTF